MSVLIGSIVDKLKGLWLNPEKKREVEGYLILSDNTSNKTLLLVKEGEKYWKTSWYDNTEYIYKSPQLALNELFNKHI
jgi:hypothetical protein